MLNCALELVTLQQSIADVLPHGWATLDYCGLQVIAKAYAAACLKQPAYCSCLVAAA